MIESKPDHFLDDLRLNNPWPELRRFDLLHIICAHYVLTITHIYVLNKNRRYAESIDLDTADPVAHKHIPYVIILIKMTEEWAKTHNGKLPSTRDEKRVFKVHYKFFCLSSLFVVLSVF